MRAPGLENMSSFSSVSLLVGLFPVGDPTMVGRRAPNRHRFTESSRGQIELASGLGGNYGEDVEGGWLVVTGGCGRGLGRNRDWRKRRRVSLDGCSDSNQSDSLMYD
jgi:hypothetical protein